MNAITYPADGFADDAEYLDNVECSFCGEGRQDAMRCEVSMNCEVEGCECVVSKIDSCDNDSGMWACAEHTRSHVGCPNCDPPDREDF